MVYQYSPVVTSTFRHPRLQRPEFLYARKELQEYVGKRNTKRMLVLVLEKPTKYANPLKMPQHLTMAGQYMTQSLYEELKDKAKRLSSLAS